MWLPGTELKLLLGDEICPLKECPMRPYSRRELSTEKAVLNYRFFRACKTVVCASGISARWRILKKETDVHPDNAVTIVRCICRPCNIVISMEGLPEELSREDSVSSDRSRPRDGRRHNLTIHTAYTIGASYK
jgi:hypothetical protein